MKANNYRILRIFIWLVYPLALLILVCILFTSCNIKPESNKDQGRLSQTTKICEPIQMVSIPHELDRPIDRANYLTIHYWDNFQLGNTEYMTCPNITEQAFVDYVDIFSICDEQTAKQSIQAMLKRTQSEDSSGRMFKYFLGLYDKYLYDLNSRFRNEDYYLFVVDYTMNDLSIDDIRKEKMEYQRNLILKNKKGTIATDFTFVDVNKRQQRLHELKKDYTIIYFYNPDCHACKQMTDQLKSSNTLNKLQRENRLDILALYTDNDLELWEDHSPEIPSNWINAHDLKGVTDFHQLYDTRAIPCLYLLDSKKKVLLKDTNLQLIEKFFSEI